MLPQVCVTREPEQPCEQDILVEWSVPATHAELCLTLAEEPLICWQGKREAQWQGRISWPQEGQLSLKATNSGTLVAVELSTASLTPQQRRRLGSPWSVF